MATQMKPRNTPAEIAKATVWVFTNHKQIANDSPKTLAEVLEAIQRETGVTLLGKQAYRICNNLDIPYFWKRKNNRFQKSKRADRISELEQRIAKLEQLLQ